MLSPDFPSPLHSLRPLPHSLQSPSHPNHNPPPPPEPARPACHIRHLCRKLSPILLQTLPLRSPAKRRSDFSRRQRPSTSIYSNCDRLSPSTELGTATSLCRVIPRPPLRPINPQPLSPYGERPDTSETKNILSLEVCTTSRFSVVPTASPPRLGPHSHGLPRRSFGDASAASLCHKS